MSRKNSKRFRKVLGFIHRYGLATTASLDKHFYVGNEDARKQELAKGSREGDLLSFPLHGNTKYYAVGPNARKRYGLKAQVDAKGYGPAVLPKRAAIFDFCTSVKPLHSRLLLTRTEFMSAFPELTEGLANLHDRYMFELDEAEQPLRIATFVVDAGVKMRTLTSRLRQVSIRRNANSAFRLLQDEGAFCVFVITHCEARVAELTDALISPHRKQPIAPTKVVVSSLLSEVLGNVSANSR